MEIVQLWQCKMCVRILRLPAVREAGRGDFVGEFWEGGMVDVGQRSLSGTIHPLTTSSQLLG